MLAHRLQRQKIKRFKVIKSRSRYSAVVNGKSQYSLKYEPGTEVYALPETMGIMCFTSHKKADKWIRTHYYYWGNCRIIEVIPMGKGRIPEVIASPQKLALWYNNRDHYRTFNHSLLTPPDGTICYPAVYVVN